MSETFNPTHSYSQFDIITRQRATEPAVEGQIVERVEMVRLMKEMYEKQDCSTLKWLLNECLRTPKRGFYRWKYDIIIRNDNYTPCGDVSIIGIIISIIRNASWMCLP